MFNILDKLKSIKIFEKFFSENEKNINYYNNCNIQVFENGDQPIKFDKTTKNILIYDNQLGDSEKEVWNIFEKFSQQKGNRLLEEKTNNYLEKIQNHNPSENGAIIEFFKDLIPLEDYKILKSAQFIIKQPSSEISYLKKGLRMRYGNKGGRIVNLLNAGYFEFLKELYNLDIELFKETYSQLVTEDVLTIFVHNDTNIISELETKIEKFKTYKLKLGFIHIHGIGTNHVEKIKSFVNEYSQDPRFIIKNKVEKDKVYMVEIYPN